MKSVEIPLIEFTSLATLKISGTEWRMMEPAERADFLWMTTEKHTPDMSLAKEPEKDCEHLCAFMSGTLSLQRRSA